MSAQQDEPSFGSPNESESGYKYWGEGPGQLSQTTSVKFKVLLQIVELDCPTCGAQFIRSIDLEDHRRAEHH